MMNQFLDCECNPHLALWASENHVSPRERAWEAWVAKVEKLLGHDLDGNQERDGYSLGFAHDHFWAGDTPEQYVAEVMDEKARLSCVS